jgi:CubicO group peptidase (beta-lactamase class C family)
MTLSLVLFKGVVLTLLLIVSCIGEKNYNEVFVDELMQDYNGNGTLVPGASVLVMCKNIPVVRYSYGFADIDKSTRVTSTTNFRLASLTKQFTAAAILLLAEEKNKALQLDDRIREKWLPELPEATNAITIRHLLSHTSGLINYEDAIDPDIDPNYQLTDFDVLKILALQNRTYFTPPGARFSYSNSGYALLAVIVQRASNKTFANFLRDQIFLPLQMDGTVAYENGISTVINRAFGHSNNGSSWIQTDQCQTSAVLGDGGIYSSIDDLAKWDTALYDDRLLSYESLKLAFTPAIRTNDPAVQYGMGWQISGDMLWHSGSTIGFRNIILRFPKRRLSVVVLTNRNSPEPYQTALTIAHRFFFTSECNESYSGSSTTAPWKTLVLFWFIIYSFFCTF